MLGAEIAKFKAEIDFDGTEVAKKIISQENIQQMLKSAKSEEDMEKLLTDVTNETIKFIGK